MRFYFVYANTTVLKCWGWNSCHCDCLWSLALIPNKFMTEKCMPDFSILVPFFLVKRYYSVSFWIILIHIATENMMLPTNRITIARLRRKGLHSLESYSKKRNKPAINCNHKSAYFGLTSLSVNENLSE